MNIEELIETRLNKGRGGYKPKEVEVLMRLAYVAGQKESIQKSITMMKEELPDH